MLSTSVASARNSGVHRLRPASTTNMWFGVTRNSTASCIRGSASTVLGSPADLDPAVVRQFFRIIDEQADNMHDLVSDVLDVVRIEKGTLPVSP